MKRFRIATLICNSASCPVTHAPAPTDRAAEAAGCARDFVSGLSPGVVPSHGRAFWRAGMTAQALRAAVAVWQARLVAGVGLLMQTDQHLGVTQGTPHDLCNRTLDGGTRITRTAELRTRIGARICTFAAPYAGGHTGDLHVSGGRLGRLKSRPEEMAGQNRDV